MEKAKIRSTTVIAVKKDGKVAMAGDGQVTLGDTVCKGNARKVRKIYNGKILTGFAGSVADAFTLLDKFEEKIKEFNGDLTRSAVELAKMWRTERSLQKLEAMLIVADKSKILLISGDGNVIEPENDVLAIGSGGNYAYSAALAYLECSNYSAKEIAEKSLSIAGNICIYTNHNVTAEVLEQKKLQTYILTLLQNKKGKTMAIEGLTPKQIVEKLDQYIIGQEKAKRAVAVALRNRLRRIHLSEDIRDEVAPKNILMIGPTGSGKTEIARRLAKLVNAPFIKVEATKYTEVGYVGRDVESMIRDLMAVGFNNVKAEMEEQMKESSLPKVEEKILDLLLPGTEKKQKQSKNSESMQMPENAFILPEQVSSEKTESSQDSTREKFRQMLREGKLEDREVEVTIRRQPRGPSMEIIAGGSLDDLQSGMQDLQNILTGRNLKKKMVTVREARKILQAETLDSMIDPDKVADIAKQRVEQSGIVFIDEIDKIATKNQNSSGQVSREGVQRDILPIVEGSKVNTKWGVVDTTHILFIAAGAFSMGAPSDLIPELQGRFPLRVELESLTKNEFKRILLEPKNALTKQYTALLETEGLKIEFSDDAIDRMSFLAEDVNSRSENIGARRLHTIMEKVLEDASFSADEHSGETLTIDAKFVDEKLRGVVTDVDLSRYILQKI